MYISYVIFTILSAISFHFVSRIREEYYKILNIKHMYLLIAVVQFGHAYLVQA